MKHIDKIQHAVVGFVIALFALVIWTALAALGLAPLLGAPPAAALASLIAGIAKEGADWIDNRAALAAGESVRHGVEPLDVVATAVPGLIVWAIAARVLG